jgi:hypothetical protein
MPRWLKPGGVENSEHLHAVGAVGQTGATLLLGCGVNPKIVSEMLGHSSVAIPLICTRTSRQRCNAALSMP